MNEYNYHKKLSDAKHVLAALRNWADTLAECVADPAMNTGENDEALHAFTQDLEDVERLVKETEDTIQTYEEEML